MGGVACEGGVSPSVVVVVEEVWQSGSTFVVAGEDLPVGPFRLQGAVEAFNFAVLPRTVGADELVGDAVAGEQVA